MMRATSRKVLTASPQLRRSGVTPLCPRSNQSIKKRGSKSHGHKRGFAIARHTFNANVLGVHRRIVSR